MDTSKKLLMYDETDKERECLVVRSTLSEMYSLHHANCYHVSELYSSYRCTFPGFFFSPSLHDACASVSDSTCNVESIAINSSRRHQIKTRWRGMNGRKQGWCTVTYRKQNTFLQYFQFSLLFH